MKKKAQHITAKDLMDFLPEEEFSKVILDSGIDYQVKKLYGRSMFYLLLYGLLECERTSLRSLEDVFNSTKFKVLFNLDRELKTKYNSISDRLSTMNVDFFKQTYELFYKIFSDRFDEKESLKYNITRVDSSMVAEVANKLDSGMIVGVKKKNGKKQVKYTMSMTNLFPSSVEVFTGQSYLSEDIAISEAIKNHTNKGEDNVFVFDRGVQSRKVFNELDKTKVKFVSRLNDYAKSEPIEKYELPKNTRVNNLTILSDEKVVLFDRKQKRSRPFRLIKTEDENQKPFWLLTNLTDEATHVIIEIYKRRWDIEVFFRFIKQELSFKHFISTNINGIKIILYMTLILSMLILLYKKVKEVGYKTAKRKFYYEIEELYMAMIIKICGGNPDIVFR